MIATFSLEKKNRNFWWIFHRFFLGDRCGNDWTFPLAQRLQTKKLYKVCRFLEVLGIYLIDWTDICLLGNVFDLDYVSKISLLCFQINFHSVCEFTPYINLYEIFSFSVLVKFSKNCKNSVTWYWPDVYIAKFQFIQYMILVPYVSL